MPFTAPGGNRAAVAQLLGISRSTPYLWMRELGIETESPADPFGVRNLSD